MLIIGWEEYNYFINYLSSVISGKYCNFIGLQECDLSINRTDLFWAVIALLSTANENQSSIYN
jgi:hypothetical protein